MGMELKKNLENYLDLGGSLQDPVTEISRFDAGQLASAIYYELVRAQERKQIGITIKLDLVDAKALADFLKNRSRIAFI